MANLSTVIGGEAVLAKLKAELDKIEGKTVKGLILAAAFVRRETENTPPLTPVDLGNLRASWFVATPTRFAKGGGTIPFKGPKASIMATEHSATISEAKGMVSGDPKKPGIVFGYSANYALYVHENLGMHNPSSPYWMNRKKKWRPNSGPKWFQSALGTNTKKMAQIIADNAKIL